MLPEGNPCEDKGITEATVAIAVNDMAIKKYEIFEPSEGKHLSPAYLVGCEINEEKTNPVEDKDIKANRCSSEEPSHVLAVLQSVVDKPMPLSTCVAFKSKVLNCQQQCTESGQTFKEVATNYVLNLKIRIFYKTTLDDKII